MMPISFDTSACFAEVIGRSGLSQDAHARLLERLEPARRRLAGREESESAVLMDLPYREDDLPAIREWAERLAARCSDVAVIGTGGSSLGARTLAALVDRGLGPADGWPRLHFLENIDPDSIEHFLERVDAETLGLLMVSKSGGTAETLALSLVLLRHISRKAGPGALAERTLVITEERDDTPLARLAEAYGLPRMAHDPAVGGRFSALSNVGLLPAALAGLDPAAVRCGAAEATSAALAGPDSEPAKGAAIVAGLLEEAGVNQTIVMPYVERLDTFSLWYRQLWAESLGKDGRGTTPIRALGTVDQHSQLQLYLGGPWDKYFTLIWLETAGSGAVVTSPAGAAIGAEPLPGRRLGDLLQAEALATADSLVEARRPIRRIKLGRLDAWVLGYLLQHYILETLFTAELFGVSPFGQPAVERGKELTRDYLARLPEAVEEEAP